MSKRVYSTFVLEFICFIVYMILAYNQIRTHEKFKCFEKLLLLPYHSLSAYNIDVKQNKSSFKSTGYTEKLLYFRSRTKDILFSTALVTICTSRGLQRC